MILNQPKLLILFILGIFLSGNLNSQNDSIQVTYEIKKVYPPLSIPKDTLVGAHTIHDINKHYKSSWVKNFVSVEVITIHDDQIIKTASQTDVLTKEQKNMMETADVGTPITVDIRYIPDNTLKHNDEHDFIFSFSIDPDNGAQYPGGEQILKQYLKQKVMDEIEESLFELYQLSVIKFAINEKGQVVDAHVSESSNNLKVDEIMLEAVCNMPVWSPASYANGTRAKQEHVLMIGDMRSCLLNTYNIREFNFEFFD